MKSLSLGMLRRALIYLCDRRIAVMQVDISEITKLTQDRDTSIRLVREYRQKYKGKSTVWVVERIVSDLYRDRGVSAKTPLIKTRRSHRYSPPPRVTSRKSDISPLTSVILIATIGFVPSLFQDFNLNSSEFQRRHASVLEAPGHYRQIEQGAAVTIQNSSPEGVRVTLKSLDTESKYTFSLEACDGCRYYNSQYDMPQECTIGPTHTLALSSGRYWATMDYTGQTRTESGEWYLDEGWERFGCYFSLFNEYDEYE